MSDDTPSQDELRKLIVKANATRKQAETLLMEFETAMKKLTEKAGMIQPRAAQSE